MDERIFDIVTNIKNKCLDKELCIQKEYFLSPAEYNGLLAVTPYEVYSCNQLSRKMGLSVSRSSRVLEKLIKNGYLQAIKNKDDRRVIKVALTEKGLDTRRKIKKRLDECEKNIVNRFHKSELDLLENTLNKLSDIIN
jgi:MarR family transcriptional regulator, 2-MHQ and catechol-resistance regulon repressor